MNTASSSSYASYLLGKAEGVHAQHILEQQELCSRICREMINEIVPSMIESICIRVIKEYLNNNIGDSLQYDISSLATCSIKDFNKIFSSSAFSQFISDAVTEEIRKRIDEIHVNLKL